MDNGAMENFFGRLKVEMFYGEQFETVEDFIHALDEYIYYYNNERISLKLIVNSCLNFGVHFNYGAEPFLSQNLDYAELLSILWFFFTFMQA